MQKVSAGIGNLHMLAGNLLLRFRPVVGAFLAAGHAALKLAAVIPAAVGAGIKGLGDLTNLDLPDVTVVVEKIRDGVNQQLPDDIDLPVLSDVFENATGIDFTDWLKDRRR